LNIQYNHESNNKLFHNYSRTFKDVGKYSTTTKCFKLLTTAIGQPFFGHKSPAARARQLFKPSTDSASLLVDIEKKNVFGFCWLSSGGDVTMRAYFGNFGQL